MSTYLRVSVQFMHVFRKMMNMTTKKRTTKSGMSVQSEREQWARVAIGSGDGSVEMHEQLPKYWEEAVQCNSR